MRSTPLRVAFIGAGNMAGLHLRALRRVSVPHTVVGVFDANTAAARAFAARAGAEARAFDTLAELLAEGRPDLVHVCTPAGTHLAPARLALLAGAHVYVEKPFVETRADADALFAAARSRGRIVCAGHQLVREPAYRRLMRRVKSLGAPAVVTSEFAFRPPKLDPARASGRALAAQLIDVLPHPLYTLIDALERVAPAGAPLELIHATGTPTDLHALLWAGGVTGRLQVSLRARPVASSLTVSGADGSLTADFVRAIVTGAANPGTSPVEKLLNPFLEAAQLAGRSAVSLMKRFLGGGDYPGLVELLSDFYVAAATGRPSPLSVEHLRRVAALHEDLAARVREAAAPPAPAPPRAAPRAPVAVVTGAGGFFGASVARQLARRGFRVRGIGRGE
ncbi:MAG TPA: Gfo/Idh/MocA family oxidoreductase, partial [Gemmatimonadales bacterium]